MQKQSRTARPDAGARHKGVNEISLEGRSVIVAMCVGQLGSLLPHVVVPSILAAFLIPEWHLSGAQAGLLAGSGAAGYMLTVPVLGDADRPHRCAQDSDRGLGGQRARHVAVRPVRDRPVVRRAVQRDCRRRLCGRLYARPQGADGSPCAGRFIPRHHALHIELLVRRRPVVSGFPTRRGSLGLAQRIFCHRRRAAGDADGLPAVAAGRTQARVGTPAGFRTGVPEPQGDGICARLRRALLRTVRHPDLDRRVLDLRRRQEFGRFDPDADRGQRGVLHAGDAREHSRQ